MRTLGRFFAALLLVAVCSTTAGLLLGAWHHPKTYRWGKLSAPRLPDLPRSPLRKPPLRPFGSRPDLYGNPLAPAVATYGIDAWGGAVEQHYPDTRVRPLRSPEG